MVDNVAEITELNEALMLGASRVEVDGQVVDTDLQTLKDERRRLTEADSVLRHSRPRVMRIDLSQGP